MTKHVFIIKERLCQSFWQLVKAFRFEAKKSQGEGGPLDPILEASRVNVDWFRKVRIGVKSAIVAGISETVNQLMVVFFKFFGRFTIF